jgi:WD40 repeat protein
VDSSRSKMTSFLPRFETNIHKIIGGVFFLLRPPCHKFIPPATASDTMPPPRPPSWIDPLRVPVFGMTWHTLSSPPPPRHQQQQQQQPPMPPQHIIAYSGGGGSAKTGVHNHVVVQMNNGNNGGHMMLDELSISTGDKVGIAVRLYEEQDDHDDDQQQHNNDDGSGPPPSSSRLYLLVSLGDEILQYELLLRGSGSSRTNDETAAVLVGRFDLPPFELGGVTHTDMCNALAVNHQYHHLVTAATTTNTNTNTDQQPGGRLLLALGCESGLVRLYAIVNTHHHDHFHHDYDVTTSSTSTSTTYVPINLCQGHIGAVCAVHFANHHHHTTGAGAAAAADRFVSSAKDGTARVWQIYGTIVRPESTLICDCTDPNAENDNKKKKNKKPSRPMKPGSNPIMVRGCAFAGDNDEIIITVASPRRGAAFLTAWHRNPEAGGGFGVAQRTLVSSVPVSAMAASTSTTTTTMISGTTTTTTTTTYVALGTTDGTILIWDINHWTLLRKFDQIHELPVTCIVLRPHCFDTVDGGDPETTITVHARSASADGKLACLSLQKHIPTKRHSARVVSPTKRLRCMTVLHHFLSTILIVLVLSPILQEICWTHTGCDWNTRKSWWSFVMCLVENVVWAPGDRPGLTRPPF